MNVRRTMLLAAGILLAAPATAQDRSAQERSGAKQEPPAESRPPESQGSESQGTWYERGGAKAREAGKRGADATARGASKARQKTNQAGQAATAAVVGTKTVTGRVADVSKDQVTVRTKEGQPLNLRVTEATKVLIGGEEKTLGALQQGTEVRASYAQSGGSATATKIEATRTPGSSGVTRPPRKGAADEGAGASKK